MSDRILNESAIREHALACSKAFRGGKFTRVGQEFLDEVRVDVEALLVTLRSSHPTQLNDPLPPESGFLTGILHAKVTDAWNDLIGRIIQTKVRRQPSVGQTLSRTR